MQENDKTQVEISFSRSKDGQYCFNSYLMRKFIIPEKIWLLAHSKRLVRRELKKPLKIDANLLFSSQNKKTDKQNVKIADINNKECFFVIDNSQNKNLLKRHMSILINTTIKEKNIYCHANIENIFQKKNKNIYHAVFQTLEEDIDKLLINLHNEK